MTSWRHCAVGRCYCSSLLMLRHSNIQQTSLLKIHLIFFTFLAYHMILSRLFPDSNDFERFSDIAFLTEIRFSNYAYLLDK